MAPEAGVGGSKDKEVGEVASTVTDKVVVALVFPAVSLAVTVKDLVPEVAPDKAQVAV